MPPRSALSLGLLAVLPLVIVAANFLSPGLTPEEVFASLDTEQAPLVIDVRKPFEFKIGHVPGAINIPIAELGENLDELKSRDSVLVYCINGRRTRQAEPVLLDAGVSKLYHLEGAFQAWIQKGLTVEKGLDTKRESWD